MSQDTTVKLIDVEKSYVEAEKRRVVLTRINAELPRRKFIVIRGRSGSGKSTLLNLLGGLDLPDSGDIGINGRYINKLTEQERTLIRRHKIGFVFQFFNLIPTLTVAENLAFPLELNNIKTDDANTRIDNVLEAFSLHDRRESFPDQLSGGEQQRIAIARAVIHTPSIVLADEPTGNLDSDTEREVLDLLNRLPEDHEVTVICATHSPEVAARADEIYELDNRTLIRP